MVICVLYQESSSNETPSKDMLLNDMHCKYVWAWTIEQVCHAVFLCPKRSWSCMQAPDQYRIGEAQGVSVPNSYHEAPLSVTIRISGRLLLFMHERFHPFQLHVDVCFRVCMTSPHPSRPRSIFAFDKCVCAMLTRAAKVDAGPPPMEFTSVTLHSCYMILFSRPACKIFFTTSLHTIKLLLTTSLLTLGLAVGAPNSME